MKTLLFFIILVSILFANKEDVLERVQDNWIISNQISSNMLVFSYEKSYEQGDADMSWTSKSSVCVTVLLTIKGHTTMYSLEVVQFERMSIVDGEEVYTWDRPCMMGSFPRLDCPAEYSLLMEAYNIK